MLHQLPLFFSYQASDSIWQLKTDGLTACLGLEVRSNMQEATFSYLCPQQDKVIFEELSLEGGLLTHLLACHAHVLLLQQFPDLENPVAATTVALDARSQEVLWAVNDFQHLFFHEQESIGRTGEEGWAAVTLLTGEYRSVADDELKELQEVHINKNEQDSHLLLPVWYEEGSADFKAVAEFLHLYLQEEPLKVCEYLHVFDKIVISFYTAGGEKLTNQIAVFDEEGNLLLHQILASNLLQIGSETFMVWKQQLFFIENSSCLKGYNLL